MKKVAIILLICSLLVSVTAAAASDLNSMNIKKEYPYHDTIEEISYSIDSLSLTNAEGKTRSSNSSKLLSMEISVSSDTAFEMATPPRIALDENFEQLVAVSDITFKKNTANVRPTATDEESTSSEQTLVVEAYLDKTPSTVYVQMPVISKTTNTTTFEPNVQFTAVLEGEKIVDDKEISMFALQFEADDFSIIPRMIILDTNGGINSLLSKLYLDDDGNIACGYFYFIKPDNFELSNTYDVIVNGTFEISTPVVTKIDLT